MKKVNLLILDDKEENIVSLRALLEEIEDINIISSTEPNEALKICWRDNISIALIDVQMPDINGFEFVSLVKSNPKTSHIMAIMVTAISKEDRYLLEGLQSGAVDYLYKPLNPDITRAKVVSFVNQIKLQQEVKQKNQELEISRLDLMVAKEEAEQARKSKELFLANMSHEIRTPINGIMGIIHMLRTSPLSDEQKDWLDMLDNTSQSLLTIINDILDLSKIDSGKFKIEMESFSLSELLENLDRSFRIRTDNKDLIFSIEKDDNLPETIVSDSLRLQQILNNFLSNGVKFTEKGQISLVVQQIASDEETSKIRFTVKDTGIGIRENHLAKIFQVFEQGDGAITRRYGGTGLGLSIVKRLSELLHGEIGAESTYGNGSTFYFEAIFKKGDQTINNPIKKPFKDYPKITGTKILIAEDNELNAFILTHMLKVWDASVDIVANGQLALEYVEKNNYDIILMDTHMPVMSGFEAIKEIKKHPDPLKRSTPIITISASVLQHEQAAALEMGAQAVIGKPVEPSELYEEIKKLVQK